jgi:hypothetical protein
VRTEHRRGAVKHYYRAIQRPMIDTERFGELPEATRQHIAGEALHALWGDVRAASASGGFDRPDIHVSRSWLTVDEEGYAEVASLLEETLARLTEIQADAVQRRVDRGHDTGELTTAVALLHFERAPTPPAAE